MSLPSPLSTGTAALLFLFLGCGDGREMVQALPSPRCQQRREVEAEGSRHPQIGVRLPKVSDGDIFDPVLTRPSPYPHDTDGGGG